MVLQGTNGLGIKGTTAGGTLDGVTVNGDLDLTGNNVSVTVVNGLTLNGPATGGVWSRMEFSGTQTLGGAGTVVFGDGHGPMLQVVNSGTTLTLGPGLTVRRGSNASSPGSIGYNPNYGGNAAVSVVNLGTISADTSGRTIRISGQSFSNQGDIEVATGALLDANGSLVFDGLHRLDTQPDGRGEVSGNLSGNTRASDHYLPLGTTVFDGAGTSVSPQLLEVMGQDFGMSGDGFNRNFSYGTIALANNTYVRLVDQADNAPGTNAEALYVNSLVISTGSTLDLN